MKLKSISFKTAFIIVVLMHGLGFYVFSQYSSIRAKLSRIEWDDRIRKRPVTSDDWPKVSSDKLVKTLPKPQIGPQSVKPKPKSQNVESSLPKKNNVIYSKTVVVKNGVREETIVSEQTIPINYIKINSSQRASTSFVKNTY